VCCFDFLPHVEVRISTFALREPVRTTLNYFPFALLTMSRAYGDAREHGESRGTPLSGSVERFHDYIVGRFTRPQEISLDQKYRASHSLVT